MDALNSDPRIGLASIDRWLRWRYPEFWRFRLHAAIPFALLIFTGAYFSGMYFGAKQGHEDVVISKNALTEAHAAVRGLQIQSLLTLTTPYLAWVLVVRRFPFYFISWKSTTVTILALVAFHFLLFSASTYYGKAYIGGYASVYQITRESTTAFESVRTLLDEQASRESVAKAFTILLGREVASDEVFDRTTTIAAPATLSDDILDKLARLRPQRTPNARMTGFERELQGKRLIWGVADASGFQVRRYLSDQWTRQELARFLYPSFTQHFLSYGALASLSLLATVLFRWLTSVSIRGPLARLASTQMPGHRVAVRYFPTYARLSMVAPRLWAFSYHRLLVACGAGIIVTILVVVVLAVLELNGHSTLVYIGVGLFPFLVSFRRGWYLLDSYRFWSLIVPVVLFILTIVVYYAIIHATIALILHPSPYMRSELFEQTSICLFAGWAVGSLLLFTNVNPQQGRWRRAAALPIPIISAFVVGLPFGAVLFVYFSLRAKTLLTKKHPGYQLMYQCLSLFVFLWMLFPMVSILELVYNNPFMGLSDLGAIVLTILVGVVVFLLFTNGLRQIYLQRLDPSEAAPAKRPGLHLVNESK